MRICAIYVVHWYLVVVCYGGVCCVSNECAHGRYTETALNDHSRSSRTNGNYKSVWSVAQCQLWLIWPDMDERGQRTINLCIKRICVCDCTRQTLQTD